MDLKVHLRAQHGYPVCLQQLLQAESCLENFALLDGPLGRPLGHFFVFSCIGFKRIMSMGIFAGRVFKGPPRPTDLQPDQMVEAADELVDFAAETGHVQAARALLQAGADTNSFNSLCMTALTRASYKGHIEIVRVLLEADADMNLRPRGWCLFCMACVFEGSTALMLACSAGHVEIARLLLEARADYTLQDSCGRTALMHAACSPAWAHVEIVHLLLKTGADKDLGDWYGWTTLKMASALGCV